MYKDFKQTESLDTGFVGGSSLLWMFSGIVLGLLVGLGMYFFSNDKMPKISMIDSLEKKIQKVQTSNAANKTFTKRNSQNGHNKLLQNNSFEKINQKTEKRRDTFSYYAVLPTLNVPVGSVKPINTSTIASNSNVSNASLEIASADIEKAIDNKIDEQIQLEEQVEIEKIGDYLLQVASFKKQSMANKTRGRLSNKGIDARVQKKKIKGRFWYRVVAGPVDQNSVDNWKLTAEKLGHKHLVISVR